MVKTRTVITDSDPNPNVQNPSVLRETYYRRGVMRKKESLSNEAHSATPSFVDVANCDTKTGFLFDVNTREYRTYNVVKFLSTAQLDEYLKKNPSSAVQVESRTTDTGERKAFFGYPAKHLITTIKRRGDAHGSGGEETIDGWYFDHERPDNHCAPEYTRHNLLYLLGTLLVTYPEVPQFKHIGPLPMGLVVKQIRTVKFAATKNGTVGQTVTAQETIEDLSDAALSPSMFELPSDAHENPQLPRARTGAPR
jgi:hypothetical protein